MPTGHYPRKKRAKQISFCCEVCGKVVSMQLCFARQRTMRYCSRRCAMYSRRKPHNFLHLVCERCGKEITRHRSHVLRHVYCSSSCSNAARRKAHAKWRDPGQIRGYMQEYEKRNRRRINQNHRDWVKQNRNKRNEVQRKYRRSHKTQIAMLARQRRAGKEGGSLSVAEWEILKATYDYMCLDCGRREPAISLEVDHIVPLALGGAHLVSNIQPLCRQCNAKKGAKTRDYRQLRDSSAIEGDRICDEEHGRD